MDKTRIYIQTENELFLFKGTKPLLREMEDQFNKNKRHYPSVTDMRNLKKIIEKIK